MTTPDLDEWYKALWMENCMTVMELLEEDSRLLTMGWKDDPSRFASGELWDPSSNREKPDEDSKWRGRTALHVGARRGCVDLIKQVLLLCDLNEVKNYHIVDEQSQPDNISATCQSHGDQQGVAFSRKDVTELVSAQHGLYKLDALGMAALHCNMDIIVLLIYAYSQCDNPPPLFHRNKRRPVILPVTTLSPKVADDKDRAYNENRALLRKVTRQFIDSLNDETRRKYFEEYSNDLDFNFLHLEEYLFHFCWSSEQYNAVGLDLWKKIQSSDGLLWRFLLELHDGQGRTPFHVAVDAGKADQFVKLFPDEAGNSEMVICALTARDSAGRTPTHRAAVMVSERGLGALRVIISDYSWESNEISATCYATWRHPCGDYVFNILETLDAFFQYAQRWRSGDCGFWDLIPGTLSYLSKLNGLRGTSQGYNPLHGAVIHRNYESAKVLMGTSFADLSSNNFCYFHERTSGFSDDLGHFANLSADVIEWGLIEFACLVRADIDFVRFLLEKYLPLLPLFKQMDNRGGQEDLSWAGLPEKVVVKRNLWQAIHLISSFGNYEMMELFIDYVRTDPFVEDFEGNTTLHHAMKVRKFEFGIHLLDIFPHFQGFDLRRFHFTSKAEEEILGDDLFRERQECIILLWQCGCEILQTNHKGQVPYPQGDLKKSKFLSWWRGIQEKEFLAAQNKMNFDSNAITVTAALVATASYVGPLQPPMGYAGDPNQIHDNNVWVVLFIVCDTISFYLAIASIILSLILCVPRHQQSIMDDLLRTRRMLTYAIGLLFPSVLFVFVAFGCSSLAVISTSITSSAAGGLTVATTCVGGLLCLFTVFVISVKLLAFVFPGNRWIRFVYNYF